MSRDEMSVSHAMDMRKESELANLHSALGAVIRLYDGTPFSDTLTATKEKVWEARQVIVRRWD